MKVMALPGSVSESLSVLVILEVNVARLEVHTVLHRDRLVNKRSDLLQYWLPTLYNGLGVGQVETKGCEVSLDWRVQPTCQPADDRSFVISIINLIMTDLSLSGCRAIDFSIPARRIEGPAKRKTRPSISNKHPIARLIQQHLLVPFL